MPPSALTQNRWVTISAVAFVVCIALTALMLWAKSSGWLSGTDGPFIRFTISIALGAAVAAFTVGGLRAHAALTGEVHGIRVQVGGALAAMTITVVGAFWVTQQNSFAQGFYLSDSSTKKLVTSETATVVLLLNTGPREVMVGANGFAEFRELPMSLFNVEVEAHIKSARFDDLPATKNRIRLNGNAISLELIANHAEMREFKKRVALNVIALLAPLRVLAGDSFGNRDEANSANYSRPEVLNALLAADLYVNPGKMTVENMGKMFVYLFDEPTWRQELLNASGAHHERIARAAHQFSTFYFEINKSDRNYLSDTAQKALHALRYTQYVERFKNSVSLDSNNRPPRNLIEAELKAFLNAISEVERSHGPLNSLLVQF